MNSPDFGLEAYRQMIPYPFTMVTLEIPSFERKQGYEYELLGQVTHVPEMKWFEQVSNFASWRKDEMSEYQAHPEKIAVPYTSFIRFDLVDDSATKVIETSPLSIFLNPMKFEMTDNTLTLKLIGKQFSSYVCVLLDSIDESATPINALVSDHSENGEVLGS